MVDTQPTGIDGPSDWHVFTNKGRDYLFVVDGSRVYEVDREVIKVLNAYHGCPSSAQTLTLQSLGLPSLNAVGDEAPEATHLRSISLAVAQKCNLGCTYCYAQQGSFGGEARAMRLQIAKGAVDRLLEGAAPSERVNIAFLGGEPLLNRSVLQKATEYAAEAGRRRGVPVGFSITTNGTLITEADAKFFERHGFAVTVSLDGLGGAHDQLRPTKGGRSTYEQILDRVRPLLTTQRKMQISARVTVTPKNLDLKTTLQGLIDLGFHSVGFSPMLSAPTGRDEMQPCDLDNMLDRMIDCGHEFERNVLSGSRFPFSNMVNSMMEIHRGTHRPYPCGAGASYLGVSADGELAACHRFVGDELGALGNLDAGIDRQRQIRWLADRHVHRQQPCQSCWARYLCGGGCHHEVIHRGRPACGYIRGWLNYCLEAYARLLGGRPDYFGMDLGSSS